MNLRKFRNSPSGKIIDVYAKERYAAFVPNPLPPPPLNSPMILRLLSDAASSLGRLVGAGQILPNPYLLTRPYMHQEAVLSSRIEGTQASLSDLYLFEAAANTPSTPADVVEVINYLHALQLGLKLLDEDKLPLSLRVVQQIHARLMSGVRGYNQAPGEFRNRQNWIGPAHCKLPDATYVPPPVSEMMEALWAWEKFLHQPTDLPPLMQVALMHYQFEAIHPFLDGNGRVGRLLIILFLHAKGHLPAPLLYLSAFFERYRAEYYQHLLMVSQQGDWENWVAFFLRGVHTQASDAFIRSQEIMKLWRAYQQKIPNGRGSSSIYKLVDNLFYNPVTNVPDAIRRLNVSKSTATRVIEMLVEADIVQEITGRDRYRIYVAKELLNLLEADLGTDPQLEESDQESTEQTEYESAADNVVEIEEHP